MASLLVIFSHPFFLITYKNSFIKIYVIKYNQSRQIVLRNGVKDLVYGLIEQNVMIHQKQFSLSALAIKGKGPLLVLDLDFLNQNFWWIVLAIV